MVFGNVQYALLTDTQMNKLPTKKQIAILERINSGTPIRATARIEGVARNTVRILAKSGKTVTELQQSKDDNDFLKQLEFRVREKSFELQELLDHLQIVKERIKQDQKYIETLQAIIAH